jgi:hypothetical protein
MAVVNPPRWYQGLPIHIRPDEQKVAKLEELRASLNMRHELFMVALASSPWAVIRAQEAIRECLQEQIPDAEERKIWSAIILARLEVKLMSPAPWDPPAEEIRRRMDNIQELLRGIESWDDVLRYILEMDRPGTAADPASPQFQINTLLDQ